MKNDAVKNFRPVMQYVVLGVLLSLCFTLQSTPQNLLGVFGIRPVLLVVLAICVGMTYGEITGGVFGFIAGILMDLYVTPSVAFNGFVLAFLGIACGLAIQHLFMHNTISALVLCLLGCLVYFGLYCLVFRVIAGDGGALAYFYRFSLPSAVYTALFGVVFYPFLLWLCHKA